MTLAVDPDPGEALLGELVEQGLVLALAPRTTGARTWKRVPSGRSHDPVDDLLRALAGDRATAVRAVGWPMRA